MYRATLINTGGSFTLGLPGKQIVFTPDNLSNDVTEEEKDILAENIDYNNKPMFSFKKIAVPETPETPETPEIPEIPEGGTTKKIGKNK